MQEVEIIVFLLLKKHSISRKTTCFHLYCKGVTAATLRNPVQANQNFVTGKVVDFIQLIVQELIVKLTWNNYLLQCKIY